MAAVRPVAPSPGDRAEQAVPVALELVDAVKRQDRQGIRHLLSVADLAAVAVTLAAMVDEDRSLEDLLGWTRDLEDVVDGWTWPDILAAHAQWEAHRYRGLTPPAHVADGQRVYDRVRARNRRTASREQVPA